MIANNNDKTSNHCLNCFNTMIGHLLTLRPEIYTHPSKTPDNPFSIKWEWILTLNRRLSK